MLRLLLLFFLSWKVFFSFFKDDVAMHHRGSPASRDDALPFSLRAALFGRVRYGHGWNETWIKYNEWPDSLARSFICPSSSRRDGTVEAGDLVYCVGGSPVFSLSLSLGEKVANPFRFFSLLLLPCLRHHRCYSRFLRVYQRYPFFLDLPARSLVLCRTASAKFHTRGEPTYWKWFLFNIFAFEKHLHSTKLLYHIHILDLLN